MRVFVGGPEAPWLAHALITLAIALPMAINLVSAGFVSRSDRVIVALKVLLLAVVVVASIGFLAPGHWAPPLSIVSAGMVIFVAYEGFELIANSAEDIRDPRRNLPRALIGAVVPVMLLYVLVALITVSTADEARLRVAQDYVLAVAAEPALGASGFTIVAVAPLLATLSAINATIYGNARLGYVLAKDGLLPERFDHEHRDKLVSGIVATAVLSMLLTNTVRLADIAIIGSASFLLVFALVNLAA